MRDPEKPSPDADSPDVDPAEARPWEALVDGANIGDLFACLYDHLRRNDAALTDLVGERLAPPAGLADAVRRADGGVPSALRLLLRRHTAHPLDLAYAAARAIDEAFGTFDAARWPRLAAHLAEHHSLTTHRADPALLPARATPPAGAEPFAGHFPHLRRLRLEGGTAIRLAAIPEDLDFPGHTPRTLRVLFLPAAGRADVRFEPCAPAEARVFEVVHEAGAEDRIFRRLVAAVAFADLHGAELLLAPELSFTPALWERVRRWLRDELSPTSGLGLRWLLLGTAAVDRDAEGRPRNQALLVGRHGEELLRQNKAHPFVLEDPSDFYGLGHLFAEGHTENIRVAPRVLELRDSRALGRLAVLICEDLAHVTPGPNLAGALGAELYLAPVMDGEFEDWRWVARWAEVAVTACAVRVLAVTSLVLPERGKVWKPGEAVRVGMFRGLARERPAARRGRKEAAPPTWCEVPDADTLPEPLAIEWSRFS